MTDDIRSLLEEQPKPKTTISIFAILSLVAGIGTYVWFITMIGDKPWLTLILGPVIALIAILTGHMAKKRIRNSINIVKGKKLANTGLVLGYIYFLIGILLLVLSLVIGSGIISAISSLV
jgi:hypothetical protein